MKKPQRIVVIGAGINGLVAANRLARAGHQVTLIEREPRVGGAARGAVAELRDGSHRAYPLGATVLGLMQDFVFNETGLAQRVVAGTSVHPTEYQFRSDPDPVLMHRDPILCANLLRNCWGEHGDLEACDQDAARVIEFLQEGYRHGRAPSLTDAKASLSPALIDLWITGSAERLLDHYLTSDKMKVVYGRGVMESGPVSVREPWSALSLSIADSGSVFGGRWGYVRGGIWQLLEALAEINRELGVDIRLSHEVKEIDVPHSTVRFWRKIDPVSFDQLVFASDPLSAAQMLGDGTLERRVKGKRLLGTSGKLIALFNERVRWKNDTGHEGYDSALKFVIEEDSLAALDAGSVAVVQGGAGFVPGFYEIYAQGAGDRMLGLDDGGDSIMVFFKHLNDALPGDEMTWAHDEVLSQLLSRIANPGALAWSRLLTPNDLTREFSFPRGNIDHVTLCEGQTFMARTYADVPDKGFYRFGSHQNVWYCGAGAYPCGSVTGTSAWMCVEEMLRNGL